MFDRFTEKAIKSVMLAQKEARRLNTERVGTEMLLLGLVAADLNIAAQALKSNGAELNAMRIEVESLMGRGSGLGSVKLEFTPSARVAIEMSWAEAQRLKHPYVSCEHLLLGLISEIQQCQDTNGEQEIAGQVLANLGVELAALKMKVMALIDGTDPEAESPQADPVSEGKDLFERYSADAIKIISLAQEEARRLGFSLVGSEVLLLGMIGQSSGVAARVLQAKGLNLKAARVEVEKIFGRGSGFVPVEIPFNARTRRVLQLSREEDNTTRA